METRKRVHHMRRTRKLWMVLLLLLVVLLACYWLINVQIRPALRQLALARVNALTSDAMYSTVLDCLNDDRHAFAPFVDTLHENGAVYYVALNNRELTRFASLCAQEAQERLVAAGKQGIQIPIGSVSGLSIFSGMGPDLTLTFTPETNTQAYFESEFRAAGINQTLHRVNLRMQASLAIALPGEPQTVTCYVDVPIAEHIIVGTVPDTYANVGNNPDLLHLVPLS